MHSATTSPQRQGGSFILEALVSLLIFMLGLIALLGVASLAINQTGQSKYRNDASYLASELIGEMWINSGTPAAFVASTNYSDWQSRVAATLPSGAVTATVTGSQIALDISWVDKKVYNKAVDAAHQDADAIHHYLTTAQIAKN